MVVFLFSICPNSALPPPYFLIAFRAAALLLQLFTDRCQKGGEGGGITARLWGGCGAVCHL